MRLAMRISPSRVSSSTVPISRMYMRTGSVVRPSSASSAASAAAASSIASSSAGRGRLAGEQRLGIRCLLVHRDAHVVDGVDDVFDLLGIDDLGGQVIVHLRVGEVALLLAARDQQLQLRLAVLGHRRYAPLDAERALVGVELAAAGTGVGRAGAVAALGVRRRGARAARLRRLARERAGVLAALLLTQARHCGDRLLGGGRFTGCWAGLRGASCADVWGLCLRVMCRGGAGEWP